MRTKITHSEPFDQYLLDNYKNQSLKEMCAHVGISVHVGRRALTKLGIVRDKELRAKFMGHKNHNDVWDNYFKKNYLIQPLAHMCRHLGINVKVGERMMKRLGLVRPPELVAKFKSRNLDVVNSNVTAKIKKPIPAKVKRKIVAQRKLKVDKVEKKIMALPTRQVDYSQKIMVKIDHKTWVYRDKTA